MFSDKDIQQIKKKGITHEQLEWQLSVFRKGISPLRLHGAATIDNGIIKLSSTDIEYFKKYYDSLTNKSKVKFVPASGAASRMFKALFEYIESGETAQRETTNSFADTFFQNISRFGFYRELKDTISDKGESLNDLLSEKEYSKILNYLLTGNGLNYGNLPKGLIKFHKYGLEQRTPFEEHLAEAIQYARSDTDKVALHFTVSPEHLEGFNELLSSTKKSSEDKNGVSLDVSFSVQKPSTDTMAVDQENNPFREPDQSILFRPGGHGALIDNLNELESDLIFIKNIDNVVPEKFVEPTIVYKKAIAGKLLEVQSEVFQMLNELDSEELTETRTREIYEFIKTKLCYVPKASLDFNDLDRCTGEFKEILNRPIRVCGVVKNLGEPGGGPFWAPNSTGDITLQIVESSQVDLDDPEQAAIFKKATHFNPVDLVCCPIGYKGQKFDLPGFVDQKTCFISKKSKDGKKLKALELPGLWNGAMADWLTLFVEVPVETFNPVKTVNDLLRPEHQ